LALLGFVAKSFLAKPDSKLASGRLNRV
jgi:hypothetical protein